MARVFGIGQPENDSEREAIAFLRDTLPNSYTILHNFEIRQGIELFEIDLAILGPPCVYVVDVKGTHGLIDVYGSKWYPEGRAPYHSPLAILRKHAKALKSLICDHERSNSALKQMYVEAAVILTSPDATLVDPEGRDAPFVTSLAKSASFFQNLDRIPPNFSRDIRQYLASVERAIIGRAKPRSSPPRYGNWQVEEKLGGDDRYTEFRARHVMLGDRRGGSARLRVYQVDPYLSPEEGKRQQNKISNGFRAVANLPGHPNILTVREFFETEAKDRYVLVTEDVAGHALRQHIKKLSLALTYDQKIGIIRDTLSALDHAHRSNPQVVHRNVTPDAILVSSSGRALLTAFDYARAGSERTSSSIADQIVDDLEPLYQAPECYRDPSRASVVSDLYSAGFVFFELLVGEPPFASIDDMLEKDGTFPIAPSQLKPELPAAIDDWLQKLCAFDAEDRYLSAAVAREQLNEIVGPDPRNGGRGKSSGTVKPIPVAIDYWNLAPGFELARRFTIEERLGKPGGFAVAYKVFDSLSDSSRVLKLVVKDRRSTLERLKQEYKALLSLKPHPNVVKVEWADQLADETPYIVFEYLPGFNVEELIENKAISLEDALKIARETALGLQHLHAHGLFHRDIKPSNLLWTDTGVKIIDFNVAVRTEEANDRQGGTRRYIPSDLDLNDVATVDQEIDRDLFALGITTFECVTGGKYPWPDPRPSSAASLSPDAFASEISSEFAALIKRAITAHRTERFSSATEFLEALERVNPRRPIPVPIFPAEVAGTAPKHVAGLAPNFNPFVLQLLSMYSQSRGNAGTRGLDEVSKQTYVSTLLDTHLRPAVLEGKFRLVVITGNAGDGKTAFIQQLESDDEVSGAVEHKLNGSAFRCRGRQFFTNYDGSQDEESKLNDDVLQDFFDPFSGPDDREWPVASTHIIAINEGRFVDFLSQHKDMYPHLSQIVRAGLAGASPQSGVAVVNLNLRAIVADLKDNAPLGSIFDRLLRSLVEPRFWGPCANCDIADRCFIYHNVRTLQDSVAGPKVAERLKTLYHITHLRGGLHMTMRDVRSALAYTLAGAHNCDEIHALYSSSSEEARHEVLNGFYFNSWRGAPNGKDRLLLLLRELDVGEASNPDLDRALDYLGPDGLDVSRLSFPNRNDYDRQLLERAFRHLPRELTSTAPGERVQRHREHVGMLRRRHYFERRDEGWRDMLPYSSAPEFAEIVTGKRDLQYLLPDVLMALNRGEGLSDPARLGNSLALRVRTVDRGSVRSFRLFSGAHFELRLSSLPNQEFLEYTPQAICLVYRPPSGESADLQVNLDIYEMLKRLNAGYQPNLEELQGYYLSLSVFKNVLGSAPYQEVLVSRSGYDFFRIRRDPAAKLHIEPVTMEVRR